LNPFKKLAGQTAIYGLPTIVGRLLNYLLVPLYTRVFSPAEYGVVTEIYAYVAFLFVILTYGMETAFFRFTTSHPDKGKVFGTSLFSLLISSSLFVLIVFISAPTISSAMGYANNQEYIKWFALILAADAISCIPYAQLRLTNRAFRFAFVKITNIASNIGFNVLFIILFPYLLKHHPEASYSGLIRMIYDPEIGVGYIFISNLISSVLTFVMLLPGMIKTRMKPDLQLLRSMLQYSWPLLIFGLAGIVNETFDRIILPNLLPSNVDSMAQLGIYGACYKVSILMTLFVQTYRYAAEPFFFDTSKSVDAKKTYARLMNYFIIICLFIFLVIMLNIDIVLLFIGKDFREGAKVIPILLWANLFLGVFYNLSIWFKLTDKTRKGALISVLGAAVTLAFNFMLIPSMGYMGAAWATFICYAFMMVLSYLLGQKYYPVNYNLKAATLYSILTLAIYFVSGFTDQLSTGLKVFVNFILLMIFIAVVITKEGKGLIAKKAKG